MFTERYVATTTFRDEDSGILYEEGGVYDRKPRGNQTRAFDPCEHVALCPRCGQRFAATEGGTAEDYRDFHVDGDEDVPSICEKRPPGRPSRVPGAPSRRRLELRFTDDELAVIKSFAKGQGLSMSDAVRIGVLDFIHERTDGDLPGVVLFKNRIRRCVIVP